MKKVFTLLLLFMPLAVMGQAVSRTELRSTNAWIDARMTNGPTIFNPVYPTNAFNIGTIYSGRGAYAFYGDDEELVWGGIRTNSTLAKLATYAYRGTASSGSNSHLLVELQNDNYGLLEFGSVTSGNSGILSVETTSSSIDMYLKNNGVQKVTFKANGTGGFLGINTNSPSKALSVNGGVQFLNLDASNPAPVAAAVFDASGNLTHGALGSGGAGEVTTAQLLTVSNTAPRRWNAAVMQKAFQRKNYLLSLYSVSMNTVFSTPLPQTMMSNGIPFNGGIATSIGNNWMNRQASNAEPISYNSGTNYGGWGGIGGPWWDSVVITNDAPAGVVQWNSLFSNTTFQANFAGIGYLSMPGLGWFSNQVSTDNGATWTTALAVDSRGAAGQTNWYYTNFALATANYKFRVIRQNGTNCVVSSPALINTNRYGWSWFPAAIGSWNIDNLYTNWWGATLSTGAVNFFDQLPKSDALVWLTGRPTDSAVTNTIRIGSDVHLRAVGTNGDMYYMSLWGNGVLADELKNRVHNNAVGQEARRIGALFVDAERWFDQTNHIQNDGLWTDGVHPTSRGADEYFAFFARSTRFHPYITHYPDIFVDHPQYILSPSVVEPELHWTNGNKYIVLPKIGYTTSLLATNDTANTNLFLSRTNTGRVLYLTNGMSLTNIFTVSTNSEYTFAWDIYPIGVDRPLILPTLNSPSYGVLWATNLGSGFSNSMSLIAGRHYRLSGNVRESNVVSSITLW